MINITYPFLPPKEEYINYVDKIYDANWLTNLGPLATELEINLQNYLKIKNLLFVGNGTIALQLAIKALNLKGEIITTPFSYIATTTAIVWENCIPVFADICPKTLNIDPDKIEALITSNTTAILATHVFGNPCNIEKIDELANRKGLKVIYDAAHCFGVRYKERSVFEFGDVSATSFHATKIFHTVEGGALITNDEDLNYRISKMRNFGHVTPTTFDGIGINGKNSEFHAAMGICNLKYMGEILSSRKTQYIRYYEGLKKLPFQFQEIEKSSEYNYSYFPIIFESEEKLIATKTYLENNQIFTRRYFYPSLSSLDYLESSSPTPISDSIARRVLCLPLYHDLEGKTQDYILEKIIESINQIW